MSNQPATVISGVDFYYLWDMFARVSQGEPLNEDDEEFAAGMLKYGLLECCDGKHFDDAVKNFGYVKEGGAI